MTIDPLTNYIAAGTPVGPELWAATLPIAWVNTAGNAGYEAPVTAGLAYRLALTYQTTSDSGYWFLVRELDEGGGNTGTFLRFESSAAPAGTTQAHEFVAAAGSTRVRIDLFNFGGPASVTITAASVRQIDAAGPYIRLGSSDDFDAGTAGALYADLPVVKPDGSVVRARVTFSEEADLKLAHHTTVTFPDAAYQSPDSITVLGEEAPFNGGNNDHILAFVRPPNTAPEIWGGNSVDDLLGNVHGQEVLRAGAGNATVEYDPLGDGTWIPYARLHYPIRCKRVRVRINTRLTDPDAVARMDSDHLYTLHAGGGIRCDRTDTVLVDTTFQPYFWWMASFDYPTAYVGRRGHGAVQDGADVTYAGGGATDSSIGYESSWMALKRADGLVYALAYDRAATLALPGVAGLKSRVWYDPSNANSKLYTEIEFGNSNTVPAGTALPATLWAFLYAPASTSSFHAEMARLGVADTDPPTVPAGLAPTGPFARFREFDLGFGATF
ncbi:MAG: hypothetical protein JWO31_1794 [Phycisphaerales bacterium]|nr:hypothetical protein [Phycisphaerales bacterium]